MIDEFREQIVIDTVRESREGTMPCPQCGRPEKKTACIACKNEQGMWEKRELCGTCLVKLVFSDKGWFESIKTMTD